MAELEPTEIFVLILVGATLLVALSYLVSLIAIIPPIRKKARESKSVQRLLAQVLGIMVCLFAFLAITRFAAETSFEAPPHGVVSGVWDDFENHESGALFMDEKTEEELYWDDNDLRYISRERFLRYMRPPFLRHSCYTAHSVACRWADIDLLNFDNTQEWIDFIIRLMVGIASGFVTGFMISTHTKGKEILQPVKAG